MTAIAIPAESSWTAPGLVTPSFPQSSSFSLHNLISRFVPQPKVFVSWEAEIAAKWIREVVGQLMDHLTLQSNWDSYGGRALTRENFEAALSVFADVMGTHSETPWVVPLPSGGVQFEWHRPGLDIEIAIDRENSFVLVTQGEVERELSVPNAIGLLRGLIPVVNERA